MECFLPHLGTIPVGIKLHCRNALPPLSDVLRTDQHFNAHGATYTYILPPSTSAQIAIEKLRALEEKFGLQLFDNPEVLIQVCHPARLSNTRAAVLGVCFIATSDWVRTASIDLRTTHNTSTNRRPLIYDYDPSSCDRNFLWLSRLNPFTVVPFQNLGAMGRTDVLTVQSAYEITVLNFVATLLVHHQYRGAWVHFGNELMRRVKQILNQAQLGAVLDVLWVAEYSSRADTEKFYTYFVEFLEAITAEAESNVVQSNGVRMEITRMLAELEKGMELWWNAYNPEPMIRE